MPCKIFRLSTALETAAALSLIAASAPEKMLMELFAVVALESANHATLAAGSTWMSSNAPSTVKVNVPLLLPVTDHDVNFADIQSRFTAREMPDDDSVTEVGIAISASLLCPRQHLADTAAYR